MNAPPPIPTPVSKQDAPAESVESVRIPTKVIVQFVIALTALATGITAYIKPETSARKSYDVLAHAIEDQSKATQQNHDDLVALRGYLEAMQSSEHSATIVVDAGVQSVPVQTKVKISYNKPPPPISTAHGTFAPAPYKAVTGSEDIR